MYLESLGLIFLSFSTNVRSAASANDDTDDVSPLYIDGNRKFVNISLSEELMNMREEFSGKWNNYKLLSTKWKSTDLTWSVHNYAGFPEEEVDRCIRIATSKWAKAAKRLKFTRLPPKSKKAHIKLEFVDWIYETAVPAIACSPGPRCPGSIKFTLAVHWTLDRTYGMNAACILTHEMGHALGLDHSPDTKAIMYMQAPCEGRIKFKLGRDDIKGIQALYPDDGSSGGSDSSDSSDFSSSTDSSRSSDSSAFSDSSSFSDSSKSSDFSKSSNHSESSKESKSFDSSETSGFSDSSDSDGKKGGRGKARGARK